MLHKFTVEMKLEDVENTTERLNIKDYYNLYYEQPFEQLPKENGYEWMEIQDAIVEFNIILEEYEIESVEVTKGTIAAILNLSTEDIKYHVLDMHD